MDCKICQAPGMCICSPVPTDPPESFKDEPVSIGELRADKDRAASKWKPRDALISLLREIDSGKNPEIADIVICFTWVDGDGDLNSSFKVATASRHNLFSMVGLLERCKQRMMESE